MKRIYMGLALGVLASCGDVASQNEQAFSAYMKDGKLRGTYNPAGWTSEEVRESLASGCPSGALSAYTETAQANGLIAFSGNCG